MTISPQTFDQFARLISQTAGIQLSEKHNLMLQNRMRNRILQLRCHGYSEYLRIVREDRTGTELLTLIDAVTTNYTSLFRNPDQFRHLQDHLVQMMQRKPRRIRIWSAACSTGEEAYTIAMTAAEAAKRANAPVDNVRILATDIATSVLERSSHGFFPASEVKNIPASHQGYIEDTQKEHSLAAVDASRDDVPMRRLIKPLRDLIIFRRLNLCDSSWSIPNNIDIIFCRNVLIYFDQTTQKQILKNCSQKLADGGLLYVGACESVREHIRCLTPVRPSVLCKPIPTTSCGPFTISQSQTIGTVL